MKRALTAGVLILALFLTACDKATDNNTPEPSRDGNNYSQTPRDGGENTPPTRDYSERKL